ncbi:MAG: hypothetical protein JW895_03655 [Thermoleophilaceae bacterium]|nr:hypothetical protein [Thermoleophilaceae bacterium]
MTAAWAVAATAIAVFAFITASDNDADAERVDAAATQVQAIERRVNRRLESFSGQLESGPFTARVENLEGAIRDIRDLIATRDRQWKRFEARNKVLNGKITFLEQAVRDLRANQDAADQTTTP